MNPFNFQASVFSSNLPSSAKLLILAIGSHYNYAGNLAAFPSIKLLEKETGLSKATIHRMKKILEKNGWLTQTRKYNQSNRYIIMIPDSITMRDDWFHGEELTMNLTMNKTMNKSSNEDLVISNINITKGDINISNDSANSSLAEVRATAAPAPWNGEWR